MNLRSQLALASTALLLVLAPAVSHAGTYNFTVTEDGVTDTFSLPSSPVVPPAGDVPGQFFDLFGVAVSENGVVSDPGVGFGDTGYEVDFGVLDGSLYVVGPTLFTGTDAAPTFILGDFTGTNFFTGEAVNIDITAATPEPSSLLLMGSGLISFAGLLRRKLKA